MRKNKQKKNAHGSCERTGQYDMALKLLNEMRKRRIRFYEIGILDELFKRLLAAVALLRGYPLPPSLSRFGNDATNSNAGGRSDHLSRRNRSNRARAPEAPGSRPHSSDEADGGVTTGGRERRSSDPRHRSPSAETPSGDSSGWQDDDGLGTNPDPGE